MMRYNKFLLLLLVAGVIVAIAAFATHHVFSGFIILIMVLLCDSIMQNRTPRI
jgi:hypothetical protein